MNVEPIDDIVSTDTNENYIQDLETEIEQLQLANKLLEKKLSQRPNKGCCDNYKVVVKNFHKLLNDVLPF